MKYIMFMPKNKKSFVIKKDCIESMMKSTRRTGESREDVIIIRTTSGNEFTITEDKDGFDDILKALEESNG